MNCRLYPVQLFLCMSDGWPGDCLLFLMITAILEARWSKLWQLLKVWSVGSCMFLARRFCLLNPELSLVFLEMSEVLFQNAPGTIVTVFLPQFVERQGIDETCCLRHFLLVSVCSTTRYVVLSFP